MLNPNFEQFLLKMVANKKDCQCPRTKAKTGTPLRLKVLERDAALRAGSFQTQEAKNENFRKIFQDLRKWYDYGF